MANDGEKEFFIKKFDNDRDSSYITSMFIVSVSDDEQSRRVQPAP